MNADVRAQFEAWAKGRDLTRDTFGVSAYVSPYVDNDWEVWQAALAARQPVGQEPVSNLLNLCRDSHPPLMSHSSSYGGVWASDWCVVFRANGSACIARYEVSEMDKRCMDETGAVPNFPWRVPGFGHVVAWAMVSDVVAHISRLTDAAPPAQAVDLAPRSMDTAPRDGTMVRLLVQFEENATEDTAEPAWTIGACNDDNVGEDERIGWQFAGWCWTHDHFTEGKGTPVGWLPLVDRKAVGK